MVPAAAAAVAVSMVVPAVLVRSTAAVAVAVVIPETVASVARASLSSPMLSRLAHLALPVAPVRHQVLALQLDLAALRLRLRARRPQLVGQHLPASAHRLGSGPQRRSGPRLTAEQAPLREPDRPLAQDRAQPHRLDRRMELALRRRGQLQLPLRVVPQMAPARRAASGEPQRPVLGPRPAPQLSRPQEQPLPPGPAHLPAHRAFHRLVMSPAPLRARLDHRQEHLLLLR